MAIHLRPRLQAAMELLPPGQAVVADIGCDHGRLSAALLQAERADQVIAADIGAEPLEKARALLTHCGLLSRASVRLGDGLSVLSPGEASALFLCGMGGERMVEILSIEPPLMGAACCILQPMRGAEELRQYLYAQGYCVEAERIVRDGGRIYEALRAAPGQDCLPPGWPEGYFGLGHRAIAEPLFPELLKKRLMAAEAHLARAAGTRGEAGLRAEREALLAIERLL